MNKAVERQMAGTTAQPCAVAVAQICNLPYRRIAFGKVSDLFVASEPAVAGGLQIRDTADYKSALRFWRRTVIVALALLIAPSSGAASQAQSPDGRVTIHFTLQPGGFPAYWIDYVGRPLVLESRLGFEPAFTNGFEVVTESQASHSGQWTNRFGERRLVPDSYRELSVDLKQGSGQCVRLEFRAYDEGAALRYSFPGQPAKEFHFTGELTEFRFPAGTLGYEEHSTEGEYRRVPIAHIQPWCERPLTLEFADGRYACLTEAANQHYARMLLSPATGTTNALISALGGATANTTAPSQRHDPNVTLRSGESTPWRVFIVGERPGDLLERNYLVLNLNPPCALTDVSWIKPGKVMRDVTLSTTNSKAIMDFAETAGLQYALLDWKWYGSEDPVTGDATAVRVPNLDLPELIRNGRGKDVGLILYVDRRQIRRQREVLFPLYERWGVKGVKIGFVNVGPQQETAWITDTIREAAAHHLMVNVHDGYRPTGLNRTWPNLMTVEGIRGNEHMPTPEHNCTLPFTRYIAGPGDYTVCYYDRRLKTTKAHQLAMAVVSFSPWQCLFWYDRPEQYRGEPEIEFFRRVPTVWDDTKVIHGEIGKCVAIARRSGDDWFVGVINGGEARTLQLPLSFLDAGKRCVAHIFADDDSVATRTKVAVTRREADSRTVLEVALKAGGGEAIWISSSEAR